MSKIIFANWKGRVKTETEAVRLARATDAQGIVLCPPHEFLNEVAAVVQHAALGTQDYAPDAFARGARYALVGHADRRSAGDTDAIVADKLALAVTDGLVPVLCVGESCVERNSGATHGVLKRQVKEGLSKYLQFLASSGYNLTSSIYITYEPLWAISSGKGSVPCSSEAAISRIAFIKEQLLHWGYDIAVKYLYGGSVTAKNCLQYLNKNDIDGLLVGSASVNPNELKKIWHSASKS